MNHRFRRNNKAVSTIFGMVFFLLIVVIVFSSFAIVLDQSTQLEKSIIQARAMDNEKAQEAMVLRSFSYDGSRLRLRINNTGSISGEVVSLWVEDITLGKSAYVVPLGDNVLLPNDQKEPYGDGATIPGANLLNDQFRYWFVTARGNQFTFLERGGRGMDGLPGTDGKDGENGIAEVANGVGYLAFDFESITYFTVVDGKLTPYPSGIQSYTMPVQVNSVPNIAIGFNVTFMNKNYDYSIGYKSHLWSYFAGVPGHTTGPVWNIVSNQSASIDSIYSPIKLLFNQTKFIIYYNPINRIDSLQIGNIAAINLIFFGDLTNRTTGSLIKTYGQNVPFVSIHFK